MNNWNWVLESTRTGSAVVELNITQERALALRARHGGMAWETILPADRDPSTGVEYGTQD